MKPPTTRRNRQTGTQVTVGHAHDVGLEYEPNYLVYYTICEDHDSIVGHETKSLANSHASVPAEWCDCCAELLAERETNDAAPQTVVVAMLEDIKDGLIAVAATEEEAHQMVFDLALEGTDGTEFHHWNLSMNRRVRRSDRDEFLDYYGVKTITMPFGSAHYINW